jgi:hypothetical protein
MNRDTTNYKAVTNTETMMPTDTILQPTTLKRHFSSRDASRLGRSKIVTSRWQWQYNQCMSRETAYIEEVATATLSGTGFASPLVYYCQATRPMG